MAVREWFAGKEILLTGVTSATGRVVFEKLLRSCPGIKTIYVVLRSKDSLIQEEQIKKIFESTGFERLRQECPNAISRVRILEGNLIYNDLGLSKDQVALFNNVSVVIHAGGPHDALLELCCELPALHAAAIAVSIFRQRGQITESLQHEKFPELPLALVRFASIGPALKEPMPGFVTELSGATALMVGAGYAFGNVDFPAAILPVDLAANTLIVSAWDKGTRNEERTVTIFNVPTLDCTWGRLIESGRRASKKFPYPSFGIRGMTSQPWLHWLVVLMLEWFPSALCDVFLFITGGKPRIVREHVYIRTTLKALEPILSKSWNSDQNNVSELNKRLSPEDQEDFSIRTDVDLEAYLLCAAAVVKKLSANDNSEIITNFKRVLAVVIIIVTLYIVFI